MTTVITVPPSLDDHTFEQVLEQLALDWLLDVLRLPGGTAGAFVTGASLTDTFRTRPQLVGDG